MTLSISGDHSGTMLKLFLRKSCPKSKLATREGWMNWFRHLLSWPLWPTFFRLTGICSALSWSCLRDRGVCCSGEGSRSRNHLGAEGELVFRAESVLIGTEARLLDRSITVEQLRLLETNTSRFLQLCRIWDSYQKDKKIRDKAHSSIRARIAEIEKFDQEKRLVDQFVGACVSVCVPVNGGISTELRQLSDRLKEDVSSKELKSICHLDPENATEDTFFPVPQSCHQYLQPIANAIDSNIFKTIWNEKAREVGQQRRSEQPPNTNSLLLSEIVELICAPVISQWQRLCREVQDGSISLERVSGLFGCLTNDSRALTKELNCINICCPRRGNNDWERQRQEQIEQYSRLRDKIQAAHTLKDVLGILEFPYSFREIDIICQQVCSDIFFFYNFYKL